MELSCPKDNELETSENMNIKTVSFDNILRKEFTETPNFQGQENTPIEYPSNRELSKKGKMGRKEKERDRWKDIKKKMKEDEEKRNYFQQLWKDYMKNIYVNMFVRKLKQIIVKESDFDHPLL